MKQNFIFRTWPPHHGGGGATVLLYYSTHHSLVTRRGGLISRRYFFYDTTRHNNHNSTHTQWPRKFFDGGTLKKINCKIRIDNNPYRCKPQVSIQQRKFILYGRKLSSYECYATTYYYNSENLERGLIFKIAHSFHTT